MQRTMVGAIKKKGVPGTDAYRPDLTNEIHTTYIVWIKTNLINIRHMFDWFISTKVILWKSRGKPFLWNRI